MIKKLSLLVVLVSISPVLGGCMGCSHVDAGHVGIEIDSCSGAGVEPKVAAVGYHATGPCTTIVSYPTFVQTAVWTKNPNEGHPSNEEITFTNADQMQIAVDISLAYQLAPDKVPAFYAKFRADNLDTFTHGYLRNLAREKFDTAAGKYNISQIMGDNAAFLKEVRDTLQADLTPFGITISQFGFIGAPRPPQSVIDAINAKANAVQKGAQLELELKQSEAQAKKTVAQAEGDAAAVRIHADAQAYANQKLASSLSEVLVRYKQIEKWDGKMPQVQGGGGGGTLFNLNSTNK
jgi:regulator of protease activity HflC (stomatin/prohibitin superfamily)